MGVSQSSSRIMFAPRLVQASARMEVKPKPAAVVIPGSVQVSIQEWTVPTPGSRPPDPLVTPDGALWYTGQFANVLGRLDPHTGQIKEYHLKTPNAGPHGLAVDKVGNI